MKLILNGQLKLIYFRSLCSSTTTLVTGTPAIISEESKIDLFPSIKQQFPTGIWSSDFDENSAWAINDYSNKLLSIQNPKDKLEYLAGDEPSLLWIVKAASDRLKNLEFYKYITKTNIINGLPDNLTKVDISRHNNHKKQYSDLFTEELNFFSRNDKKSPQMKHYAVGNLIRNILIRSGMKNYTFDECVRIESFWRVSGFSDKKAAKGTWDLAKLKGNLDAGCLQFQFLHSSNYQIRSEIPLSLFVPQSDVICNEKLATSPPCSPHVIGIESTKEKPISISGHWIGSNCDFSLGCVHLMEDAEDKLKDDKEKYFDDAEIQYAMATSFASCRAQAANHGFNDFHELTYPITTKCLLFHKNRLRLFAYQLNTMQIWNTANRLNNVLWTSPAISLFSQSETPHQLNEEALENILKFVCMPPEDKGLDYKPFVYSEETEELKRLKINRKGEEVIDQPPVERFKYPRNSVYFRTFI